MQGRYERPDVPAVRDDAETEALQAQVDNLTIALTTNRRIGMAMGILMATHRITDDEAFDRIRTVSQNAHTKLRDIAETIILTGTLDDPHPQRQAS